MTWAAVGVTAVAAVSAGAQAYSSNKRAKAAAGGLDGAIAYARQNPDVFGEKIDFEAVDYSPLYREDPGYGNLAGDTIAGNQRNLGANLTLANMTNDWITADAQKRMNLWDPRFNDSYAQQSRNTQNMLRGEIPQEDMNAISARRAEANALGGGGVNREQSAADLGLSRLDVMQQGAAALTNNANLINSVDPLSRRVNPQSMFVDVGQAINSAVSENQFAASFAQSERNAEMQYALTPDPQKAGLLSLMTARAGAQAAAPQQSVFGSAATAGLTAGVGAYANNRAAQSWNRPAQAAPYVSAQPAVQRYATASDQASGFNSLSGTGAYAGTNTFNPNTGADYGQQGGLWSYTGTPKPKQSASPWY